MGRKGPEITVMTTKAQFGILIGQQQKIIGQVPVRVMAGGALHATVMKANWWDNCSGIFKLTISCSQSGRIIK